MKKFFKTITTKHLLMIVLMLCMIVPYILKAQVHEIEEISAFLIDGWGIATVGVFFLVLLGLFFENKLHYWTGFNKTWTVVAGAFVMCMIYFFSLVSKGTEGTFDQALTHASGPTFQLICFLLIAMWIVEQITLSKGINYIGRLIISRSNNEQQAFTYIFWGTFFISPFIDNVLAALMGYELIVIVFAGNNKAKKIMSTVAIIIASNAGGAFFPTGDPPLLLAWIAKLLEIPDMLKYMFVPAVLFAIPMFVAVYIKLSKETLVVDLDKLPVYKNSGKVTVFGIISIMLVIPLRMAYPSIPPYIGLMGSYILFWGITVFLHRDYNQVIIPREKMPEYLSDGEELEVVSLKKVVLKDHLNMLHAGKYIDVELLLFFLGLLTCVSVLELNGILHQFSHAVDLYVSESIKPLAYGASSSLVDNVGMQAAVIAMYAGKSMSLEFWVRTIFYICVGGTLLITGSASGVALMERSGISMIQYIKVSFFPIVAGLMLSKVWFMIVF